MSGSLALLSRWIFGIFAVGTELGASLEHRLERDVAAVLAAELGWGRRRRVGAELPHAGHDAHVEPFVAELLVAVRLPKAVLDLGENPLLALIRARFRGVSGAESPEGPQRRSPQQDHDRVNPT
jgi:hypothetical protein